MIPSLPAKASATQQQLSIALLNTNKALAKVVEDLSSQELEVISQGKDMKSLMDGLLKGKLTDSKSDEMLLSLLKNNPTLKKIGTISNTIQSLLTTLKSDEVPLPKSKALEQFLVHIKSLDEPTLKNQVSHSGIFYESKLKQVQNPQLQLKSTLETLQTKIETLPQPQELKAKIAQLLSQKPLQIASNDILLKTAKPVDMKALDSLAKEVKSITVLLDKMIEKTAPLATTTQSISSKVLSSLISDIERLKQEVTVPKVGTLLEKSISKLSLSLEALSGMERQASSTNPKEVLVKILTQVSSIQASLEKEMLDTPSLIEKEGLKELVDKLKHFKTQSQQPATNPLEQIKGLSETLHRLDSKERLIPQAGVEEIGKEDLKVVLSKAMEEISSSSHPHKGELLKQMDKMMMQIDYHQIVSHLSQGTSLYLPFVWEGVEDGSMQIHHGKEDKFYCDIDLNLSEYGGVKVRMVLYEENQINIYLHTEDDGFRTHLHEAKAELKTALLGLGILPRELKVLEYHDAVCPEYLEQFENDVDMGLDIKI